MRRNIHGVLLLDKPIGITSNDALQKVKRLFNAKKAGHTGSLDPIATGMLPICFGEATKFSQFLLDSNKAYVVTAKLGQQTTTGDSEGQIIAEQSIAHLSSEQIRQTLQSFVGDSMQVPPMFSALKYQGRPLYEFARQGIEIERQPRAVTIFSLALKSFENDLLTFSVHCSKGTYVRTLVEDIAKTLGCGAHVIELRRTKVTPYEEDRIYSLSELEQIKLKGGLAVLDTTLLPVETSVRIFPSVKLSTTTGFYLRMGQAVRAPVTIDSIFVRLISEEDRFLGIGEVLTDGRIKPHRLVNMESAA